MEPWQSVLLAIGGNAAVLLVLAFLGRTLLEKLIARDSARFELELKAKADEAIEKLRNELQLRTIEHQVRFSRLHERRIDVIADTYAKLTQLHLSVAAYINVFDATDVRSRADKQNQVAAAIEEFQPYFARTQIFLPKHVAMLLGNVSNELQLISNGFTLSVASPPTPQPNAHLFLFEKLVTDLPLALEGLEDELRKILGEG